MDTIIGEQRSVPRLDSHLGYWLRRVSNTVSGKFAQSLHKRQTSVAEWVLLRNLYEREMVTPGDLAEASAMTRGAISKIVDKLQAKGWIRSRVNPEDNRGQLLSMSPAGRRNLPELAEIANQNDQHFFSCLDDQEKSTLRRLLCKVAEHHQISEDPIG